MERRIRKLHIKFVILFFSLETNLEIAWTANVEREEEQNNCVNDESNMALLTSLDLLEQN